MSATASDLGFDVAIADGLYGAVGVGDDETGASPLLPRQRVSVPEARALRSSSLIEIASAGSLTMERTAEP